MKPWLKSGIVFVITLVILLVIFWVIIPLTGLASIFGSAYFFVAILGSFLISGFISRFVYKILFVRKRD